MELKAKSNEENIRVYSLNLDGKTIGIGRIIVDRSSENDFDIYIDPEYRGNGYGKYLFGEMIKKLKELNYKETIIKVNKKNIQVIKMIIDYGGLNISQDGEISEYVLPIR